MRRIIFSTLNKKKWIENIVFSRQFINEDIQLEFSESILESKLLPVHLVTLACLIDEYNKSGKKVYLFSKNNDLIKYLIEDLRFNAHLKLNDYNQIDELVSENVFYLWRVKNDEKDLYPRRVEDYFRRISFQEKEKYNSETKILSVAVSDFGKGIIYFEIDINQLEQEEYLTSFQLNDF